MSLVLRHINALVFSYQTYKLWITYGAVVFLLRLHRAKWNSPEACTANQFQFPKYAQATTAPGPSFWDAMSFNQTQPWAQNTGLGNFQVPVVGCRAPRLGNSNSIVMTYSMTYATYWTLLVSRVEKIHWNGAAAGNIIALVLWGLAFIDTPRAARL